MKRLTALMLCLMMALCILPAQAMTLADPFTFDLDTFQSYYAILMGTDVAWTQQGDCLVGSAADLPELQLYMNEAGQVEYMMVQVSRPFFDAGEEMGQVFGTVVSSAALGVMMCEVTDPDELTAGVETFMAELTELVTCMNDYDSATYDEKLAGLSTSGHLANHEAIVSIQLSEDGMLNIMFKFAPDGTQFD